MAPPATVARTMQKNAYTPQRLPLRLPPLHKLEKTVARANGLIGRFDALLKQHNADRRLLTLLSIQETLDSLELHYPHASTQEILLNRLLDKSVKERQPILDYLSTLQKTQCRQLTGGFLLKLHKNIGRGKYRSKQNWIGPKGSPIEKGYFFPPAPANIPALMKNLIAYWNRSQPEPLLQLALIFAQLLIIHPFMDGNGRTARILVPFFLKQKGLITEPVFFLSRYFRRHRLKYFQNLYRITSEHRWDCWIQFFLKGIIEQGNQNLKQVKKIVCLYETVNKQLSLKWPEKKVRKILIFLFEQPLFTQPACSPRLSRSQKEIREIVDFLSTPKNYQAQKNGRTISSGLFRFCFLCASKKKTPKRTT